MTARTEGIANSNGVRLAYEEFGDPAAPAVVVQAPALILHGDADPLVRVEGGQLSAKLIPKARLRVIRGMGHDFPAQLVPTLAGAISGHLQQTA